MKAAVTVAALAGVGACTALLGATDVPDVASEASTGTDSSMATGEAGDTGQGMDAGGGDGNPGDGQTALDAADGPEEPGCDACTPGHTKCQGYAVETCVIESNGCPAWSPLSQCPSGAKCVDGNCLCGRPGGTRCSGNGTETCTDSGAWTTPVACGSTMDCSDGGCVTPPSCAAGGPGQNNCAVGGTSCCISEAVQGGTFDRSYDNVTFTDDAYPATVSGFRLDDYEITVARFRTFVTAVVGGWLPPAGSGKHDYLNAGAGLTATGGGSETGWDALDWNSQLASTLEDWNTNLACDSGSVYDTWTPTAGGNDKKPIDCVTWYEAYAFCIWDGGFLPSEAEWNYAAAGGGGANGQRAYPWSVPSTSTSIDCAHASYAGAEGGLPCVAAGPNAVGSESSYGNGLFGQSDLAGNVWEWTLDYYAAVYVDPCPDCANLGPGANRVIRGASFNDGKTNALASTRYDVAPNARFYNVGARCARPL